MSSLFKVVIWRGFSTLRLWTSSPVGIVIDAGSTCKRQSGQRCDVFGCGKKDRKSNRMCTMMAQILGITGPPTGLK
jgi:hypothetical protein